MTVDAPLFSLYAAGALFQLLLFATHNPLRINSGARKMQNRQKENI